MTVTATHPHVAQDPHGETPSHPHHAPAVRTIRHDINTKPFIVIWETTRACQLVCKHCRADAQHRAHPEQLTTEQGKALLDDLAAYEAPRPLVVFTGGDAFEREDLAELCRYGTEKGLSISLSPSITPLVTPERLHEMREAGGKAISLSLDGATAETHDSFRGFPGTFDASIEASQWMREEGFRLQVNSVFTKGNIKEAPALLKTVMGMGAFMWYTFMLVPTGRGADLNALNPEEREDVLNWLHDISDRIAIKTTEAPQYRRIAIQRERAREQGIPIPYQVAHRGELYHYLTEETTRLLGDHPEKPRRPRAPMAVNSGSGFAFIDHLGDVYPNGFLPKHCGNVKQTPFHEIYTDSPVFQALRKPDEFKGKCGVCEFNKLCGGSRSTAYAMTGDYLASDPTCLWVPPAWTEQMEGSPRHMG
ncbi:TIGR04053 family radical SAM/SPASM domain-containing protein [Luteococcus japonicus]|uniref:TIGR04053 family radical SAM/SPASM domain-containing protein n=1 Tax=Luteococcus japonicus TaxID=33984 RepID=UPI003CCC6A13